MKMILTILEDIYYKSTIDYIYIYVWYWQPVYFFKPTPTSTLVTYHTHPMLNSCIFFNLKTSETPDHIFHHQPLGSGASKLFKRPRKWWTFEAVVTVKTHQFCDIGTSWKSSLVFMLLIWIFYQINFFFWNDLHLSRKPLAMLFRWHWHGGSLFFAKKTPFTWS